MKTYTVVTTSRPRRQRRRAIAKIIRLTKMEEHNLRQRAAAIAARAAWN